MSRSSSPDLILPRYDMSRLRSGRDRAALLWTALLAILYGAAIALLASDYLLELLLPVLILSLFVIWVLPDARTGPARLVESLFFVFLILLLMWPDYLALDIPGLPWITARRLIALPLALLFLIGLSVSRSMRRGVGETLAFSPLVAKLFLALIALQLLSIALSRYPAFSLDKFIVAQLYWTLPFFVGCYLFRRPGRAERWAAWLCLMLVPLAICAYWEWSRGQVPWAGRIPPFLVVGDEVVQRVLAGGFRAASGIYRVQSTSTTPLGFAEYLALTTPFLIHFAIGPYRPFVRIAAALGLPLAFHLIILTDSRLGAAGFLLSLLLYLAAWGILRWRQSRESLFGPAITLAYPLIFAAFIAATFTVGRLRRMVWGGGEHQFSTDARAVQYERGFEILAGNPFGHGIGMSAETLGFTNLAGILTIDTYYLAIALEYGVIGFFIYYGILLIATVKSCRALFGAREIDREAGLLVPLSIAMIIFLVIKSVFSQDANHALAFMMLAAMLALSDRLTRASRDPAPETRARVQGRAKAPA